MKKTTGSKPATRARMAAEKPERQRWDPEEHMRWMKKVFGNKMFPSRDAALARERADRWEK